MNLSANNLTMFLFAAEGVGGVFVALFLTAYLGGLPTTKVLHSELAFRIPLAIFGVVLLILAIAALIIATQRKKT